VTKLTLTTSQCRTKTREIERRRVLPRQQVHHRGPAEMLEKAGVIRGRQKVASPPKGRDSRSFSVDSHTRSWAVVTPSRPLGTRMRRRCSTLRVWGSRWVHTTPLYRCHARGTAPCARRWRGWPRSPAPTVHRAPEGSSRWSRIAPLEERRERRHDLTTGGLQESVEGADLARP